MDVGAAAEISEQGAKLKEAGKIEQAIACYREAIELHPSYHRYYCQLANILREQGQLVQAKLYYSQAVELNSDDSWCYYFLAEIAAQQGHISDAINYYDQAIKLNPEFLWSHYNLGRIFHNCDHWSEAIACYQQAIELDSKYPWPHFFLAEIFTKQGQNELAIEHYRQAIKFNPDFYVSYYELGRNLQAINQDRAALECYLQVIKLKPDHFWSYYYLAQILTVTGELTAAIDYYQQAIELNSENFQLYFNLGQLLLKLDQSKIERCRNLLQNKSKRSQVYFEVGLGQAWEKQGDFSRAIDCHLQAITIDPEQDLPYKILQYVKIPTTKLNQILTFYQELTSKIPNLYLAWGNLGHALTLANRREEAINSYRSSCYYNTIRINPSFSELNWNVEQQKKPNFIIIGAAKCGTSSLFNYLQQHPQVLLPYKKEIYFFDKHFNQGIDWYLAHFPNFAGPEKFITGEASTHYIFTTEVEQRIYNLLGDVKIIMMLRNPVERTISDYYHYANRGLETNSLESIIENSQAYLANLAAESKYKIGEFDYILKSIYAVQIRRWFETFKSSNILIINSESFFEDTSVVMEQVWQFLELDDYSVSTRIKHNVGNYPVVSDRLKQELATLFRPYNQQLEQYLGREFNW